MPRDQHASRNTDKRSNEQREQGELKVRGQIPRKQLQLLDHEEVSSNKASTTWACRIGVSIS